MLLPTTDSMDDLKLKFEGQTHQIEANTLINSLLHFTTIVQEVNRDLDTGRKVEVKVNALPEGSFLIHFTLQTIIDAAEVVFTRENLAVAKEIVDAITGIYNLTKNLKGKKPKKVESTGSLIQIETNEGTVIVINNPVYNIYKNNRTVREALAEEFDTLEDDPNVTGFQLLTGDDKPLVEIPREDFSSIANPDDDDIAADERVLTKSAILNIHTLSFDPKIKWVFYYEGNRITARISSDFAERIDAGESFAKGDSLEAEIEIRQQLDPAANAYANKGYKILRIIKHIPRAAQGKLGFEENDASQ